MDEGRSVFKIIIVDLTDKWDLARVEPVPADGLWFN